MEFVISYWSKLFYELQITNRSRSERGLSSKEVKQLIKRDLREQQLGLTYTDGYSIGQAASHK